MWGAGDYSSRFVVQKYQAPVTKGAAPTYPDSFEVWVMVQPMSSTEKVAQGMMQSSANVMLYVRGYPDIDGRDRLRDKRTDELYVIDGKPAWGDNELRIAAHTIPNETIPT